MSLACARAALFTTRRLPAACITSSVQTRRFGLQQAGGRGTVTTAAERVRSAAAAPSSSGKSLRQHQLTASQATCRTLQVSSSSSSSSSGKQRPRMPAPAAVPHAAADGAGAAPSQGPAPSPAPSQGPPVLLLDIMDTIVYDPFFQDMPRFFNLTFKELMASKHPTAWVQFERDEIPEEELLRIFFSDGRSFDGAALKQHMADCYRYLDGMESLLQRLAASGVEVHAFSNYPAWWQLIEAKLQLSQYLRWTFVSCLPPLKGLRKPAPESFAAVVAHLGVPPERLLFVDDRQANVDGALAAGIPAVRFESAQALEDELRRRGVLL